MSKKIITPVIKEALKFESMELRALCKELHRAIIKNNDEEIYTATLRVVSSLDYLKTIERIIARIYHE